MPQIIAGPGTSASTHIDRSLTIDTHHHILPDFFWRETTRLHSLIQSLRKDSKP